MGIFGDRNSPGRVARAEMEEASRKGRQENFEEKLRLRTGDEKFAHTYRNRGRLYDKINVSLHTMDIIIYVIVALIVIALIVGILLG